jgi:hypothetical protein
VSRDDWFRNERWDADIESAFRAKLARSRSGKPQYLVIQAGYLAKDYPDVALQLIDEFLTLPEVFEMPLARCVQARALETKGNVHQAISALKLALAWEVAHPGYLTTASIDYPMMVARHRIVDEYDDALTTLLERFKPQDFSFPATRYRWNGCQALIRAELGQIADARHFAERALAAASDTQSPFRYHRSIGLVETTTDDFGRRIKRIVRPSGIRKFLRLFSNLSGDQ